MMPEYIGISHSSGKGSPKEGHSSQELLRVDNGQWHITTYKVKCSFVYLFFGYFLELFPPIMPVDCITISS